MIVARVVFPNPGGPYGTYAFGLSGRSNVLTEFAGGDGQIAIHGTNQPQLVGTASSHGCIRVTNDVANQLARSATASLNWPSNAASCSLVRGQTRSALRLR